MIFQPMGGQFLEVPTAFLEKMPSGAAVVVLWILRGLKLSNAKADFSPKLKNAKVFENYLNPAILVIII